MSLALIRFRLADSFEKLMISQLSCNTGEPKVIKETNIGAYNRNASEITSTFQGRKVWFVRDSCIDSEAVMHWLPVSHEVLHGIFYLKSDCVTLWDVCRRKASHCEGSRLLTRTQNSLLEKERGRCYRGVSDYRSVQDWKTLENWSVHKACALWTALIMTGWLKPISNKPIYSFRTNKWTIL